MEYGSSIKVAARSVCYVVFPPFSCLSHFLHNVAFPGECLCIQIYKICKACTELASGGWGGGGGVGGGGVGEYREMICSVHYDTALRVGGWGVYTNCNRETVCSDQYSSFIPSSPLQYIYIYILSP